MSLEESNNRNKAGRVHPHSFCTKKVFMKIWKRNPQTHDTNNPSTEFEVNWDCGVYIGDVINRNWDSFLPLHLYHFPFTSLTFPFSTLFYLQFCSQQTMDHPINNVSYIPQLSALISRICTSGTRKRSRR